MQLFIKRKNGTIDATLEFDEKNNIYTVLKGSVVSKNITMDKKFRSAGSIEKARANGVVVDGVLTKDVQFKSASTAANFVTGTSTNGKIAWRNKDGETLREIQAKEKS